MKSRDIISVICYLLFAICIANSQWVQQVSGTSSNILDIKFINRYTGWACCQSGEILKTTNGGINWFQQTSNVAGKILWGIHPVNENVVYCVGWFETIIKTTNGGSNWVVLRNGPWGQGSSFFEVFFLNANTGWMLKNYYILRTTNGCSSFDSSQVIYSYLRDIYFTDALTGVLCGDGALIMRSTDGGVNWNKITIPLFHGGLNDFYKISILNNYGWVVGRGRDYNLGCSSWRTTNYGINWDTAGRVPYPNEADNYCVFFSSINTGWCGGSYGHVYKTTNSGFNWTEENTQSGTGFIQSLWFYNDSIGWGVGGGGKIIHTTNSGMPVAITQLGEEIPEEFKLMQNFPNPFNSQTIIKFEITKEDVYKMTLYNELGQTVQDIFNKHFNPGIYEINLNASDFSSGIYFYILSSQNIRQSKKMILIK